MEYNNDLNRYVEALELEQVRLNKSFNRSKTFGVYLGPSDRLDRNRFNI